MNEDLRRRYIRDLLADLDQVGGARLEQWLRPLWDRLAGASVQARGLNPQGSPVRNSLDAYWPDGSVSEASSEANYFDKPYKKPKKDFRHALTASHGVRIVRLFSTQVAGPKAWTVYERVNRRLKAHRYELDLWDGRRMAEYIVDYLLVDDRYVTRVGGALPNLRRIAEQNAVSNRLPTLASTYGGRGPEEDAVLQRMTQSKVVVISGFGGIGKTELACAIAHRKRADYGQVIWVDAGRLTSVDDLRAHDVRLNGYRLNILNALSTSRTLLVLDNAQADLRIDELHRDCGDGSNVLITSQVAFGPDPFQLGFVSPDCARDILSLGMPERCPDEILQAVLGSVEGHPLVLRMLNHVGTRSKNWGAITRECAHVVGAADERRQTVADRILLQHLDVLGLELSVFSWCDAASVDAALFEHIVGSVGTEKLDRWSLTARGQSDTVRLHDLVFASIGRVSARLAVEGGDLKRRLEDFLIQHIAPKRLEFFRAVNRHGDLIERLLTASTQPGVLRYAYLHSRAPVTLNPALLGDPDADAQRGCQGTPREWVLSLVEAIESDYRRVRDLGDKDSAKATLRARLVTFDRLISDRSLSDEVRAIVQHHKAKSLIKLSDVDGALQIFEQLIAGHPSSYAAKLQVARLLENDPPRAKTLIFDIIEAERQEPGTVATSVLIETLSTLRRKHLRGFVTEMTERYGPFMASQLKAAACLGEDQPIRAFAAVGPEWSYMRPDLFLEVLEAIEVGKPDEAEDDDERVALGRLLCSAGKSLLRDGQPIEARQRFEQADNFFSQLRRPPSPFACTHHADTLIRLDRFVDAAHVLESVVAERRDSFWNLRRGEVHYQMNELPQALSCVDKGLEQLRMSEFQSTFLSMRADVLLAMGEPMHLACLQDAIAQCQNEQYRIELQEKLTNRMR